MLWTIFKLLLLLLFLAWLSSLPGQVEIAWGAWQVSSKPGALLILFLSLGIFLWLCVTALREFWSLPHNLILWRSTRKQQAGYRALLAALGDTQDKRALTKAVAARRLLGNDALSTLIAAQVAEATNVNSSANSQINSSVNSSADSLAESLYKDLCTHQETKFIALLALSRLARKGGSFAKAREYAQQAQELQPYSEQLRNEQIEIARQGDKPQAALAIFEKMHRRGENFSAAFRRLESTLRIEAMRQALETNDSTEALQQATLAYKVDPSRATLHYAQRLADGGSAEKSLGRKIVRARWSAYEGRTLAETFFRLNDASKPIERVRLFESLIGRKSSLKSRLLLYEFLLDAQMWGRAEQELDEEAISLEKADPPHQELLTYFRLRARLAKEAHNDLDGQQYWLDRLATHTHQNQNTPLSASSLG